jgi:hypothetical protein
MTPKLIAQLMDHELEFETLVNRIYTFECHFRVPRIAASKRPLLLCFMTNIKTNNFQREKMSRFFVVTSLDGK